ncbi:MAG: hypothetical protein K6E84_05220 [Lachnospiraceae bacterium]|nr:hypothetical protein [Lachnospiraceae bacterium]
MGSLFTRNSSFIYGDEAGEKVLLDLSDYMKNKSHIPFHSLSGDRTVSDIIVSLMDGHEIVGHESGEDVYLTDYTLIDVLSFGYLVQSSKPRHVLEIGAGEGILSYHLGSIVGALSREGSLTCVQDTLDPEMQKKWKLSIDRIVEEDRPKLRYMAVEDGDVMLESRLYDMVAVNGFQVLSDPVGAIKEAVKTVKPKGYVICLSHRDDWLLFDTFKYYFENCEEYYLGDSGFIMVGVSAEH